MYNITINIFAFIFLCILNGMFIGLGFGLYIKTREKFDEANRILAKNKLPQVV